MCIRRCCVVTHVCIGTRVFASEQMQNDITYSVSVLSKTVIFPKKEGRKRDSSNESVRG